MPLASAARLFRRLRECNEESIAKSGDIDVSGLADLIENALRDEVKHRGVLLAVAEFIGTALDGAAIDPSKWTPLERLSPRPSTKRQSNT